MPVERPAGLRIVGFGQRLGDVVQHRGPAQPQIVAVPGDVVQHLERMDEIVLMRMGAALLDPFEVMQLGEYPLQQPGRLQQFEADRRDGRQDDLVEFGGNALPGYDPDPRRIAADGIEGLLLDREAQLRGETHGTHHAQGVVREGDVGVARRTDDALLQVVHPVERVYQLAERIGIERPCHRIDRKVTAALVVFQRPGLDLRLARIVRVRLLAGAHEFDLDSPGTEHRRAESLENGHFGMQLAPQSFGQGDPAPHDDHVDVGRRAAKVVVAHVTADDKGPHTLLAGDTRNFPEYGVRQRHAAISRISR